MGKGTDKLYITHSEWSSGDQFSASAGAGVSGKKAIPGSNFRRLPYNFCAVSLQPFTHPVCTAEGTVFDITNILPWLKKHGTNPVNGEPLKSSELIKLRFVKNDDGEYVDPVTYKPLTNNTHIVALKTSGNVFSWDTIDRLNIKAKSWHDLISDQIFSRKDIITIQDPQHLEARDLSSFKYLKDGTSTLTDEQEHELNDPKANLNLEAIGSSAKVIKAKEAVAQARDLRATGGDSKHPSSSRSDIKSATRTTSLSSQNGSRNNLKSIPYNAASHTSGKTAASFTSTGLTPHTSNERALLSDEEYLLRPRRVKNKGYARIQTTYGAIAVELHTEFAPRAVWNFVQLSKQGYYRGVTFHRSIKNFMLQGGDPTGTGRGGRSIWGKPFPDEWAQSPLKHNARGILSMANKGRNTNTSQFFITYRAASHLDRKHTVFGRMIDGDEGEESESTLRQLESVVTDSSDRPVETCEIEDIVVFVDPFEEFQKGKDARIAEAEEAEEIRKKGGTEDDKLTWTGKRLRPGSALSGLQDTATEVGKYLDHASTSRGVTEGVEPAAKVAEVSIATEEQTIQSIKKRKTGNFGNFDGW